MENIEELMASNDPMATPVMSLGPSPPNSTNMFPPQGMSNNSNTSELHEKQLEQMSNVIPDVSKDKKQKSKLTQDQKTALVVGICSFIVLLPNVQDIILQQLPVMTTNKTLHVLINSVLISFVFLYMKDHFNDLL